MTTNAKERRKTPRRGVRRLKPGAPMTYVTAVATIVGLITGVAGLIFLVRPELQPKPSTPEPPPTRTAATLKQLSVRSGVSRAEYLRLTDQDPVGFTRNQLGHTGIFLRYRVTIRGFEGVPVTLQHELFDAGAGDEVSEERAITITPPEDAKNIERDWHTWAQLPRRSGPFIVVVKLLAEGEDAPLATLETRRFPGQP